MLAATAAALLGWAVLAPLGGLDLTVRLGSANSVQQVGPAAVASASLLAGLAGWVLLAVLERLTPRARTTWTIAALAALTLSLAGPLAGVTPASVIALAFLHLLVAAVLITGLRRSASRS